MWNLLMDVVQLAQGKRATTRRQLPLNNNALAIIKLFNIYYYLSLYWLFIIDSSKICLEISKFWTLCKSHNSHVHKSKYSHLVKQLQIFSNISIFLMLTVTHTSGYKLNRLNTFIVSGYSVRLQWINCDKPL